MSFDTFVSWLKVSAGAEESGGETNRVKLQLVGHPVCGKCAALDDYYWRDFHSSEKV